MKEMIEHNAYALLNDKYDRVCLDYVILSMDEVYQDVDSHKKAIIEAFQILNRRFEMYEFHIDIEEEKMLATKITADEFLELPSYEYDHKKDRSYTITSPIPYWYAFLEPPHKTPYSVRDFKEFNTILFPNKENIEVYRWNDEFSNYFDEGKEWWGTGLWTVYDSKTNIMVVIGASLTD